MLPLVDQKAEMLLGNVEEGTTLEATVPMTEDQLPHLDWEECILE